MKQQGSIYILLTYCIRGYFCTGGIISMNKIPRNKLANKNMDF